MSKAETLEALEKAIQDHFSEEDGELVVDWLVGVSLNRVDSDGETQQAISYATGSSSVGGYGAGKLAVDTLKNKVTGVIKDD